MGTKRSAETETTDIFGFGNRLLNMKEELHIEVFFISKNYTVYATRLTSELQESMEQVFVDPMLEALFAGSEMGMVVRDISYATDDPAILMREDLDKVRNANDVIEWIENRRDDVEYFNEEEHEFKRMVGIIARVTHKTDRKVKFYVARQLERTRVVSGGSAWQFDTDVISKLNAKVAFRVPADNQITIINNDIFAFNQSKFEKLFAYNYAKFAEADKKAALFEKKFKISVPSGLVGIGNILRESDALLTKFLKADLDLMDQDKVMDISDEMELNLMMDDAGATIIMDKRDLGVMLDILNDNYYESNATGKHYVARSKKTIAVHDD